MTARGAAADVREVKGLVAAAAEDGEDDVVVSFEESKGGAAGAATAEAGSVPRAAAEAGSGAEGGGGSGGTGGAARPGGRRLCEDCKFVMVRGCSALVGGWLAAGLIRVRSRCGRSTASRATGALIDGVGRTAGPAVVHARGRGLVAACRCVSEFDHHCHMINTCIGEGNHCRFWWFLATHVLVISIAISVVRRYRARLAIPPPVVAA